VAANVTTFTDATVNGRKNYQYRVYAYNQAGNSAYSNIAQPSATAAPLPDALELPIGSALNLFYGSLTSTQVRDRALLLWASHDYLGG